MKQKLTYIHSLFELYEVLGVIILTLSICFPLSDVIFLDVDSFLLIFICFFWIFLFRFIADNKNKVMAYLILLVIFSFIFFMLQLWKIPILELVKNEISYVSGTYEGEDPFLYRILFLSFFEFWIALAFYHLSKFERLRIYLACILFLLLFLFPIFQIYLSKLSLFFILFYLFLSLAAISQKYARNSSNENQRSIKFSIYLMPFCFLMSFFVILLPSREEPFQWKFVYSFIDKTAEVTDNLITSAKFIFGENSQYNVTFTGYNEDGDLNSGALTPSKKIQLEVKGAKATQTIYLVGGIYDYYNGFGWEKTVAKENMNEDYILDTYELLSAIYESDASLESKNDLMNVFTTQIIYKNIKTKSLFYPQKTFLIDLNNSYKYKSNGPNLLFSKYYWKEVVYDTTFLVIDYDNPLMEEIYRKSKNNEIPSSNILLSSTMDDPFLEKTKLVVGSTDFPEDLATSYTQRATKINQYYTQLPSTISNRVRELAISLTQNFDNDYDKAKAIETYLNTYNYSYQPEIPPEGEDFVDFFLFTSKSGYCTYFASSMAVLLRSLGIPTRYVEGFTLDYQSKLFKNDFEVPASNAHAWCEVYFEGVGWIPFEPTSQNYDSRYQPFETSLPASNIKSESQIPYDILETDFDTEPEEIELEVERTPLDLKPLLLILLIFIAFSFILFISYFLMLKRQKTKRYKNALKKEQIELELLQIVKIYELENLCNLENQTVTVLFQHLEYFTYISKADLHTLMDIYFRIRYSTYTPTFEDLNLYHTNRLLIQADYLKNCSFSKKITFLIFQTLL